MSDFSILGCGILSLFAAKANPKKVIACEVSPELANISKEVFKNNQVLTQFCFLYTYLGTTYIS